MLRGSRSTVVHYVVQVFQNGQTISGEVLQVLRERGRGYRLNYKISLFCDTFHFNKLWCAITEKTDKHKNGVKDKAINE